MYTAKFFVKLSTTILVYYNSTDWCQVPTQEYLNTKEGIVSSDVRLREHKY